MFFLDRIKSINPKDKVLEIGPGGNPHPRADVLLEKTFESEEWIAQSGNVKPDSKGKPTFFYDGKKFPFKDNEFDYIICTHVLEHVENIDSFVKEITRVGKKGYIEYPTIYYDYLYNFNVHITFLFEKEGKINWMPKSECNLQQFKNIQAFFLKTLDEGRYDKIIQHFINYFMQGFEWSETIVTQRVTSINDVCYDPLTVSVQKFIDHDKIRIEKLETDILSLTNSKTYKIGQLVTGQLITNYLKNKKKQHY